MRSPEYSIELTAATKLFDGEYSWAHPRAGAIPAGAPGNPGDVPLVVMMLQKIHLDGADVFDGLHQMRTFDMGQTWEKPVPVPAFARRPYGEECEITVCDFTPMWHEASQQLLGTGHTVIYRPDGSRVTSARGTAYAVYDAAANAWNDWQWLEMPDMPRFRNAGAGSTQRVDLPGGDILLPIYFKAHPEHGTNASTVVRCRMDGNQLRYIEHGTELELDDSAGLGEPSLTLFKGRFYLTIRAKAGAFVAVSEDGLRFSELKPWLWDDGSELGSYNTQQHWVAHGDALYLAYTRRGADNDHIYCHRAPLFIAQVEHENLCLLRSTERVLMPDRGARYGNFSVTDVSEHEVWVTDSEWMQNDYPYAGAALEKLKGRVAQETIDSALQFPKFSKICELLGADGSVWVSKIHWKKGATK